MQRWNETINPQDPRTAKTIIPTIVVATPGNVSPSIRCTFNPDGLEVQATVGLKTAQGRFVSQIVEIRGTGFLANEKLYMVLEGNGTSHNIKYEGEMVTADKTGQFISANTLQLDEPNMSWQVYVGHQRGVACTSFTTD